MRVMVLRWWIVLLGRSLHLTVWLGDELAWATADSEHCHFSFNKCASPWDRAVLRQ